MKKVRKVIERKQNVQEFIMIAMCYLQFYLIFYIFIYDINNHFRAELFKEIKYRYIFLLYMYIFFSLHVHFFENLNIFTARDSIAH